MNLINSILLLLLVSCSLTLGLKNYNTHQTQDQRPFYLFAHRVNKNQDVAPVLNQGYNAIEIDIRCDANLCNENTVNVAHDQNQYLTMNFCKWVGLLSKNSDFLLKSKLAMIMFDIKNDKAGVAQTLKSCWDRYFPDIPRTYSSQDVSAANNLFSQQFLNSLKPIETVDLSWGPLSVGRNPYEFVSWAMGKHYYRVWYGQGGLWNPFLENNIKKGLHIRDSEVGLVGVYVWTIQNVQTFKSKYSWGVDGILVDYNLKNPSPYIPLVNRPFAKKQDFAKMPNNIKQISPVSIQSNKDNQVMKISGNWVNSNSITFSSNSSPVKWSKIDFTTQGIPLSIFMVDGHIDNKKALFLGADNWMSQAQISNTYENNVWKMIQVSGNIYNIYSIEQQQYLARSSGSAYVWWIGKYLRNSSQGKWAIASA